MHEFKARSILNKANNMCIYNGCSNNCIYCKLQGRIRTKDRTDVGVKVNAVELLDLALRRKRKKCLVQMSSYSDPYQALESDYRLTRECLQLIRKKQFGVVLRTKSDLLLRDLDLLEEINYETKAVVMLSFPSADEKLTKKLEPNAVLLSRRFSMLEELQALNISVIAVVNPILPFITDQNKNFTALLRTLKEYQPAGILIEGFGIRLEKSSRLYFYQSLERLFPEIYTLYQNTFGLEFVLESLNAEELNAIFKREMRNSDILTSPEAIFKYLREYRNRSQGEQLSFL